MKEIFAVMAVLISLLGYIPYIIDSINRKTKPHIASWFTWALISYLAFGVQLSKGGGAGSYVNLFMGVICSIVFLLGIKNGTKNVTRVDLIALILALCAIVLWLVIDQPLASIFLVVFIDIMSFIPTFRKSWLKPNEETLITWELSVVKNVFTIFALGTLSFITLIYPLYSLVANSAFVAMLVLRRKKVQRIDGIN